MDIGEVLMEFETKHKSYWKEYNGGERAYLLSPDKEKIACIQRKDSVWDCTIYPELIAEEFYWRGIDSIEEIEWQMTIYIHKRCNSIANQLHKIRDHLPDIHELAAKIFDDKI